MLFYYYCLGDVNIIGQGGKDQVLWKSGCNPHFQMFYFLFLFLGIGGIKEEVRLRLTNAPVPRGGEWSPDITPGSQSDSHAQGSAQVVSIALKCSQSC